VAKDKENGVQLDAGVPPDLEVVMAVSNDLHASLIEWFRTKGKEFETKVTPMQFCQAAAVALGHYSAVISLDLGFDKPRFMYVNSVLFDDAHRAAPKFG